MADRRPIAFLSYVRSDDDHDDGRITAFRKRLEGEVKIQSGEPFEIFQDRNDISWGQNWEDRIASSLSDVSFLIPIVTPSFFKSPACRNEFRLFALKENTLGVSNLILPLYYVSCDELGSSYRDGSDKIADQLRSRNWTDWRNFRFKAFSDENVASSLATMATTIKDAIKNLSTLSRASKAATTKQSATPPSDFPAILTEAEIAAPTKQNNPSTPNATAPIVINQDDSGYRAFTTKFDEIIDAKDLTDETELLRLYKYLTDFSDAVRKIYEPTLTSMLSSFSSTTPTPELAISILIDNSGSMRGTKITHTAAWSVLIGQWLDRLRIPTEFLGFTTRAWKGGQSRELWLKSGKPTNPGRLNDLRHLVFKSFFSTMEAAAPSFGAMVREGLLKENIDGEAIQWAISRLSQQPAKRKLLFVISDGAPVDDSTLSLNPNDYLDRHLKHVIASVPQDIGVRAIGLEYDVSRYYNSSVSLKNASDLGLQFFELLINDPAFLECFELGSKYRELGRRFRQKTRR